MFTVEGFFRRKSDSIAAFYDDAEFSLNLLSNSQDYTYLNLFSSQFSFSSEEDPFEISSLVLTSATLKNSKQQALKDLVESAAAPYLQQENVE